MAHESPLAAESDLDTGTATVSTGKASKAIAAPADKAVTSSKASKPLKSPASSDGKNKD
jgi:hypothetical protein